MDYGTTFQNIRLSKGLKLTDLADERISASFIGKFEKNQTRMSLDRFDRLLAKLNVSMSEFFFIGRSYQPDYLETWLKRLGEIDLEDGAQLKSWIRQLQQEVQSGESVLTAKFLLVLFVTFYELGALNDVPNEIAMPEVDRIFASAVRPVLRYLERIETWGEFELRLLTLFSFTMDGATLMRLAKLSLTRAGAYEQQIGRKSIVKNLMLTLFNTAIYVDLAVAQQFLVWYDGQKLDAQEVLEGRLAWARLWWAKGEQQRAKAAADTTFALAQQLFVTENEWLNEAQKIWQLFMAQYDGNRGDRLIALKL